tara:strand:+ start:512 stop:826 length:315 start_codon:yes stop_codon:yes gene_type:complete
MTYPVLLSDWPEIMVYNKDFTPCLQKMYEAISDLELWDYIRDNPPDKDKGYMFSSDSNILKIGNHEKVLDSGHSGATFAYSMRIMQNIAEVGFNEFKEDFNNSD